MVFECDSDHSHPTRPDLARPAHQGCNHPVSTPSEQTQQFALAPALRTRLLGTGLAAIGVVTAVVVIAGSLLGDGSLVSGPLVSGMVVLAALMVLTLGLLLGLRHWVVRLDDLGYQVRALRSAEVKNARWTDVLDLQTSTVGGARCVVLRLRSGRTTTIPVDVLEGSAEGMGNLCSARRGGVA